MLQSLRYKGSILWWTPIALCQTLLSSLQNVSFSLWRYCERMYFLVASCSLTSSLTSSFKNISFRRILPNTFAYSHSTQTILVRSVLCTMGGRHSSMVSSVSTILRPWVRIPSTQSMLFFNLYYWNCIEKITKINNRGRDWPSFFKKRSVLLLL